MTSLTRDWDLPIFTANETITNLPQYEISKEESDLLKAGLYFSIQPDKTRKFEIFTTFEKIHRSFFNNFKSEETESQIKAHLSYEVVILDRKIYNNAIQEIISDTSKFEKLDEDATLKSEASL